MTGFVARWDAQQAAYIAEREQRFNAMLDTLELSLGDEPVIVDLACGPGSLTERVLDRLPGARVVALDVDPVLLAMAENNRARFGDRVRVVEADLACETWTQVLREASIDAVVSTTALHWLTPDQLLRLFGQIAEVIRPGGLFLDGDHLRFDGRQPYVRALSAQHDARTQERAFADGVDTWDDWWDAVSSSPSYKPFLEKREQVFGGRPTPVATALDLRLAALAHVGFSETGTIWQLFDDYVVYALR